MALRRWMPKSASSQWPAWPLGPAVHATCCTGFWQGCVGLNGTHWCPVVSTFAGGEPGTLGGILQWTQLMHWLFGGGGKGGGGGGGGATGVEHSTTIATRLITFKHGSPQGATGDGPKAGPTPQVSGGR